MSEATLLSFSLAFGVPYNQLRDVAGYGPLTSKPWANMESGRAVILVPDLEAVLAQEEVWEGLNETERSMALEICRQQLHAMMQIIHMKKGAKKCATAQ